MNRRDLFRGAGALALTAAMPAVVADPIYDEWTDLDLSSEPDRTAIWLVSWGGDPRPATVEESLYFVNESGRMQRCAGYLAL